MADVSITTAGKTPVELLGEGIKSYDAKDYHTAVAYLSKAAEIAVQDGGDEHESLGDIYLQYGKALLEVSRLEGDPLGDAVPRVNEEEEDEEEGDADEAEGDTPENDKEQGKPEDAKTANGEDEEKDEEKTNGEEAKVNGSEEKTADTPKENGDDSQAAGPSGESAGEDKAEETTTDKQEVEESDLQLAWEVLELARIFFEKRGEKYLPDLADTLIALGEVSLESENLDLAIRDIKHGLEIQQKHLAEDSRTLAETYYKLGMAYGMDSKHEESVASYNKSKEVLNNKIAKSTDEKEIKELQELLPEIDEKIADMKNLKDELAKKVVEAASSSQFQSSPEKKATDISHLVKRKRKLDESEEVEDPKPAKKAA